MRSWSTVTIIGFGVVFSHRCGVCVCVCVCVYRFGKIVPKKWWVVIGAKAFRRDAVRRDQACKIFALQKKLTHRKQSTLMLLKSKNAMEVSLASADKANGLAFRSQNHAPAAPAVIDEKEAKPDEQRTAELRTSLVDPYYDQEDDFTLRLVTAIGATQDPSKSSEIFALLYEAVEKQKNGCLRGVLSRSSWRTLATMQDPCKENNGNQRRTLLCHAAARGYFDTMCTIVHAAHPYIDAQSGNGATALHFAAQGGHTRCAKFLIDHGSTVAPVSRRNWTPLHFAVCSPNAVQMAQMLLENGSREHINVCTVFDCAGTALHLATSMRNMELIRLLVDNGASLTARCSRGLSPIYHAASFGFPAAIGYFVSLGVPVDGDHAEETPLQWAARHGQPETVDYLIYSGAAVHRRDSMGKSALFHAGIHGYVECFKLLLAAGAALSRDPLSVERHTEQFPAAIREILQQQQAQEREKLCKRSFVPEKNTDVSASSPKKRSNVRVLNDGTVEVSMTAIAPSVQEALEAIRREMTDATTP